MGGKHRGKVPKDEIHWDDDDTDTWIRLEDSSSSSKDGDKDGEDDKGGEKLGDKDGDKDGEDDKGGEKLGDKDDDDKSTITDEKKVEKFICCTMPREVEKDNPKKVATKIMVTDETPLDEKKCPEGKPRCDICHKGALYDRTKKHCERSTNEDLDYGSCCKPPGLKPRWVERECAPQEGKVALKYCNGEACPGKVRKCYDDDPETHLWDDKKLETRKTYSPNKQIREDKKKTSLEKLKPRPIPMKKTQESSKEQFCCKPMGLKPELRKGTWADRCGNSLQKIEVDMFWCLEGKKFCKPTNPTCGDINAINADPPRKKSNPPVEIKSLDPPRKKSNPPVEIKSLERKPKQNFVKNNKNNIKKFQSNKNEKVTAKEKPKK